MIYLASKSPRRAELLNQIGVAFEVLAVDIDESRQPKETAEVYVCRMAETKARVAAYQLPVERPLLAADTIIDFDGKLLGKPADSPDCRRILAMLSGRQHRVLTAVAVLYQGEIKLGLSENRVGFRALQAAEVEAYCDSPEPMDKAGAYAIQGRAAAFIDKLEGSYSSVMGLPLFETAELLRQIGIDVIKP